MIVDCFTYCGEADLLEIRLNVLDKIVDRFVIAESPFTFSGLSKPLYFHDQAARFSKWLPKIQYLIVNNFSENKEIVAMIAARDYVNSPHYARAFYQKEMLRNGLLDCQDDDIIYYGDADEIWKPKHEGLDNKTYKLRQLAYSYYLNNRSSEDWRGTIVTRYKNVKNGCLNDMRAKPEHIAEDGGWHFTNLGGLEAVLKKLDSYDHQEENIPWVRDNLAERIAYNADFLGRDFRMWVDETDLPQYILDHKEKYKHLWKS